MFRTHYVVIPSADGPQKHKMKRWLRLHPEEVEPGLELHGRPATSQFMRDALKRAGWVVRERESEVLVIKPDAAGSISYADSVVTRPEDEDEDSEEIEEAEEITFGLERDLQQALRRNIEQLEPGLTIVDDGKECAVEAGRIDILARDKTNALVVIELKVGMAKPDVIAQITSYMACVSEKEAVPVRGILVAGDFPKRVTLSAKMIPQLMLKQYSFRFFFNEIK